MYQFEKIKNISINYDDLTGQSVVRAMFYIEKLGGLKFCTKDSSFLSNINAIRNVIAHDNGNLKNCKKSLSYFLCKWNR